MRYKSGARIAGCLVALLTAASPVLTHPLGNFSIDHYSRLRVTTHELRLRYVIDMAEIPAFQELLDLDVDRDRRVSADERKAYLEKTAKGLVARLTATVNGTPLTWAITYSNLTAPSNLTPPGAGSGLMTLRILLDLQAEFTVAPATVSTVRYADGNYPGRTGWKEIVVEGDDQVQVLQSSASRKDVSNELTRYPPNVPAPPQDVVAEFTFATDMSFWTGVAHAMFREGAYIWLMTAVAGAILLVRWRLNRPVSR